MSAPGRAIDRVERTRRVLLAGVSAAAMAWALAVAVSALALLAGIDAALTLPGAVRVIALPLLAGGAILAGWRTWHNSRGVRLRGDVALWIERRVPSLRYALATLVDPELPALTGTTNLEAVVAREDWAAHERRAVTRAVARPLALLAIGAIALTLLPRAAVSRVSRPRPGDVIDAVRPSRAATTSLSPLRAVLTPPAYSRRPPATVSEPVSVQVLAGSDIVVEGRGDAASIGATLGDSALRTAGDAGRWSVRFRAPQAPLALRLTHGTIERLVAIEPVPDSAPVVILHTPVRDTVFREPRGTVALSADARDDIGLVDTRFEYIITSGEMESFTFRTGVLGRVAVGGRQSALRANLSLEALALQPGDVVHVRAVATDANNVTGPGHGSSETRTLRIARTGEYDSVDVEALPSIMGDTSALSQRMLIMLAEALERRRPSLARDTTVSESRRIAVDQARLRRRVADVVFMRVSGENPSEETEGDTSRARTPEEVMAAAESVASRAADVPTDFSEDESPVVAVNRPLLEAYNAMWEAGRWLEIGEPDDALPHMRAALAAIQRARQAERLYLRGRPPTQVVDVKDARLKGDRAGATASLRLPAGALGAERARLASRLVAAAVVAAASPGAAADSLLLVRLEALAKYPSFAAAVGRAAAKLRAGQDATADLLRARDALLGEPRHASSVPVWSTAP